MTGPGSGTSRVAVSARAAEAAWLLLQTAGVSPIEFIRAGERAGRSHEEIWDLEVDDLERMTEDREELTKCLLS